MRVTFCQNDLALGQLHLAARQLILKKEVTMEWLSATEILLLLQYYQALTNRV